MDASSFEAEEAMRRAVIIALGKANGARGGSKAATFLRELNDAGYVVIPKGNQ